MADVWISRWPPRCDVVAPGARQAGGRDVSVYRASPCPPNRCSRDVRRGMLFLFLKSFPEYFLTPLFLPQFSVTRTCDDEKAREAAFKLAPEPQRPTDARRGGARSPPAVTGSSQERILRKFKFNAGGGFKNKVQRDVVRPPLTQLQSGRREPAPILKIDDRPRIITVSCWEIRFVLASSEQTERSAVPSPTLGAPAPRVRPCGHDSGWGRCGEGGVRSRAGPVRTPPVGRSRTARSLRSCPATPSSVALLLPGPLPPASPVPLSAA